MFLAPGEVDVILAVDEPAGDHTHTQEGGGNIDNRLEVGDENQEDEGKAGEDIEECVAKAFLLLDELAVGRGEGTCLVIHNMLCFSVLYIEFAVDMGLVYSLQI